MTWKRTHGHSRSNGGKTSPTFNSWLAMRDRCHNVKHVKYPSYGGRGITVCDRWLESFENFLSDMGERPAGKTLDRYPDRNGNYEPDNCRWATVEEQNANRDTTGLAWKGARTHCAHGHEFTAENTHRRSDGSRQCRACGREQARARKSQRKAAA